jgi:hypothetical protein
MWVIKWTWRGHRHLPLGGAACRRTRTRSFFSAIDMQAVEVVKITMITSRISQYHHTV